MYNIRNELRHYVETRHSHLADKDYASSEQAKTLLITGVPQDYLSEKALGRLLSHFPGGVRKVWLNRDLKDLPDKYDALAKAYAKLESAETALIRTGMKLRNKALKAEAKKANGQDETRDRMGSEDTAATYTDAEAGVALAEKLVPRDKRPTHRLGPKLADEFKPCSGKPRAKAYNSLLRAK